jgi:ATP-dependent DNA helicase RecG
MKENDRIDKKSLRLVTKKNVDWDELAKDCICFANTYGGHILIGIEDEENYPPVGQKIPDDLPGTIKRKIQERTINVGIEVIVMPSENDSEYIDITVVRNARSIASTTNGRYYYRVDKDCKPLMPDELIRLMEDRQTLTWELQQNLKIPRNLFDSSKYWGFLQEIQESDRVSSFIKGKTNDEILDHYQLAKGDYLTNLGVLWLGMQKHRARLLYSPTIQFIKYDDLGNKTKKIVWDDYTSNPKELIEQIWSSIPEFNDSVEFPNGLYRDTISNYDEIVVRELLVNALAHRPYTTRGDIFINLYHDRLQIHNPGLLPIGVTPKNILHTTVQRNRHLAKIFSDLKLMEQEGSGYDKIYETLLSVGKRIPIVEERSDSVVVTIYKTIVKNEIVNFIDKVNSEYQLSSKEKISLGLIAQHNSLTMIELYKLLGLPDNQSSKNWLGRLIEFGLIKSTGKTKGTEYSIDNKLLIKLKFKGKTNLKGIQNHRLNELIIADLTKFPESSRKDIHQRIGKEIPERKIRKVLTDMIGQNIIKRIGSKKYSKYLLTE